MVSGSIAEAQAPILTAPKGVQGHASRFTVRPAGVGRTAAAGSTEPGCVFFLIDGSKICYTLDSETSSETFGRAGAFLPRSPYRGQLASPRPAVATPESREHIQVYTHDRTLLDSWYSIKLISARPARIHRSPSRSP